MIQEVKRLDKLIYKLLTQHFGCRDNDYLLIVKVWCEQNPMLRNKSWTFEQFARAFIQGEYAHPESIRRARQKAQERYPHLRGKYYGQRRILQKEFRQGILNL